MAPSSSSTKYDVFLSFRGKDTRHTFTSHLYAALRRKGIDTFIDDEKIERGDEISPTLLTAIERSKISVIIFSKDYASSSWCLDELAKIIECKNKMQHIVLPIFYDIDPSDVRKQSGIYADAFAEHEKYNQVKVQKWRRALQEAINLAGWDSSNIRLESDLIEDVVEDVLQKLTATANPQIPSEPVGVDERIAHTESLCNESADVHIVSISGTNRMMVIEACRKKPIHYSILLILSTLAMLVAFPASSILSGVYYNNGGQSKWIISWVAVAGWPLSALILVPTYIVLKTSPTPPNLMLILSYIFLGFLSAADNLMYAYAYAYLPASTASLLTSSSVVFSEIFGYFLAKNKINASIINAIVVMTAGMTIIALGSSSDRYGNVTRSQYIMGFVLDILGSALHGLIFALSELVLVRLLGRRSFQVVLEQQVMVSLFGFLFTTIGMIVNSDFQGMASEARTFKGGRSAYYLVLIWSAITFQLGVLGGTAVLFLVSTLLAGILNAVRTPIRSIAAVILLHDPMSGFKILSMIIIIWGFGSYIYGNSMGEKSS